MRLLIIEDEHDLNDALNKVLYKAGYAVDSAYDGEAGLLMARKNYYDLILLDLNLPKLDGLDVLRLIREENLNVKIIIISARVEIDDRVMGLNLGANDYVIKPFSTKELEARIRTALRMNASSTPIILTHGEIALNTNSKEVTVNGHLLSLTSKEYSILEYLLVHKNKLVSNLELYTHVWDGAADTYKYTDTLKYHIHTLKRKISEFSDFEYIINKRNQGYRIQDYHEKG